MAVCFLTRATCKNVRQNLIPRATADWRHCRAAAAHIVLLQHSPVPDSDRRCCRWAREAPGRPGSPEKRSRQPGDTAALLVPKSQCCSTALRALSRTATGDVGARVVGPGAIQAVGDPGIRQAKGRGLFRPGADHMPCLWPPPWSRPNTLKRPLLQPSLRVALQQGPLLRVALRASESPGVPAPGWASAILPTRSPDRTERTERARNP